MNELLVGVDTSGQRPTSSRCAAAADAAGVPLRSIIAARARNGPGGAARA